MASDIDRRAAAPALRLRDELVTVAPDEIVGVYVHGSAVLGDFVAGVSDLDVLVVVDDDIEREALDAIAETLVSCDARPAIGVEVSVVTRSAAARPRAPWPYLVHVTNHPGGRKVVYGDRGDPDLVLHLAVVRRHGWAAVGAPAVDVVGEIDRATIVTQLVAELRWAVDHASASYAVLNACRALRYVADGTLCSKTDGGRWALSVGIAPEIVGRAMSARRAGMAGEGIDADGAWVRSVAAALEHEVR